jgi:uncharacterized surface protein with fasciclin (FAS1) repeats
MAKKTLNALLRNKAKLKAVLLYDVVSGKVTAADVAKLSTARRCADRACASGCESRGMTNELPPAA